MGRGKIDDAQLRQYARDLRKKSTDAERRLWYFLRANRLGFKFKRQVPIKRFIVDFVCHEKRLIIELDGGQHQTNQVYDKQRAVELNRCGFQVLRFWNNDVLRETNTVIEVIYKALSSTLSREVELCTILLHGEGEGADRCT